MSDNKKKDFMICAYCPERAEFYQIIYGEKWFYPFCKAHAAVAILARNRNESSTQVFPLLRTKNGEIEDLTDIMMTLSQGYRVEYGKSHSRRKT